jgi:hypothetical protein
MSQLRQLQGLQEHKSRLLEYVTYVDIPAIERFFAMDAFVSKDPAITGVKFELSGSFVYDFLGKIEENIEPVTVLVYRLQKPARDSDIFAAPNNGRILKLAHFYHMLKNLTMWFSSFNEEKICVTYIEDENNRLKTVSASWNPSAFQCLRIYVWDIFVCPTDHPLPWREGSLVLFQKIG